jgi:hypothetical protein
MVTVKVVLANWLLKGNEMNQEKLNEYLAKYLTAENATKYAATQDKLIFCEELTDLPFQSNILNNFEEEMFIYACNLGLCKETD